MCACSQGECSAKDFFLTPNNEAGTRSHLPLTFVGMEHIILSNYALADEAFLAANAMCDGDPLLANERGIMAYNYEE